MVVQGFRIGRRWGVETGRDVGLVMRGRVVPLANPFLFRCCSVPGVSYSRVPHAHWFLVASDCYPWCQLLSCLILVVPFGAVAPIVLSWGISPRLQVAVYRLSLSVELARVFARMPPGQPAHENVRGHCAPGCLGGGTLAMVRARSLPRGASAPAPCSAKENASDAAGDVVNRLTHASYGSVLLLLSLLVSTDVPLSVMKTTQI